MTVEEQREIAERVVSKQGLPPEQVEAAVQVVMMGFVGAGPQRIPGATLPEQDEAEETARLLAEEQREYLQAQGQFPDSDVPLVRAAPARLSAPAVPRKILEDSALKPEDLLVYAALAVLTERGIAPRDLPEIGRLARQNPDQVLSSLSALAAGGYIRELVELR